MKAWLRYLIACISDVGMEYPEAHWATVDRFGLTVAQGERLTAAYDECGGVL
jgi:hypothetical protein